MPLTAEKSLELYGEAITYDGQVLDPTKVVRQSLKATDADSVRLTPGRTVDVCKKRGWSLHWTAGGAYLHLESSELIEALRGKHGDPTKEAGDVLIVLTSITENAGIQWEDVVQAANEKLTDLETKPRYKGEAVESDEPRHSPATAPRSSTSSPKWSERTDRP